MVLTEYKNESLADKQSSGLGARRRMCDRVSGLFHRDVFYLLRNKAQDIDLNNCQDIGGFSWRLALKGVAKDQQVV